MPPVHSLQKVTAGFRLTKFVVVESLEDHEVKTGQILVKLLEHLVFEHALGISVEYWQIESVTEFRELLQELTAQATEQGHAPLLHIEAHGSKTGGLEFSNGSSIAWEELATQLRKLNIASGFNLLAALSACFGGYLLGEITALTAAPCWCVVAPTETVDPAEIMQGFRQFYTHFLAELDAGKAARVLQAIKLSKGEWFSQLTQLWFERLVIDYVKTHCTHEEIRVRAKRMYRRAKEEGTPGGVGSFARHLRKLHRDVLTKQYFDVFFCTEAIPMNVERFAGTRARVERKLAGLKATGLYDL